MDKDSGKKRDNAVREERVKKVIYLAVVGVFVCLE